MLTVLYSAITFSSGPDVALTIEALILCPLKALLLTLGSNASALKPAYSCKTRPRQWSLIECVHLRGGTCKSVACHDQHTAQIHGIHVSCI